MTASKTAAHVTAMNSRTRFSFGRTFLANLTSGVGHHDTGKLSAFLVATGFATPDMLKSLAAAGELTKEVLNDVAVGVVALLPASDLPKNFNLTK